LDAIATPPPSGPHDSEKMKMVDEYKTHFYLYPIKDMLLFNISPLKISLKKHEKLPRT
jgi:hypothetical protein